MNNNQFDIMVNVYIAERCCIRVVRHSIYSCAPDPVHVYNPSLVVLCSCDSSNSSRGSVKANGVQGMAKAFVLPPGNNLTSEDDYQDCWVTVFGFPPATSSYILNIPAGIPLISDVIHVIVFFKLFFRISVFFGIYYCTSTFISNIVNLLCYIF